MASMDRQEKDLLGRLRDGERGAADDLFRTYFDPLYQFVFYRLGGSHADTEEVVQETFIAAMQSARAFDGRSSLFTWVCGIAKNKMSGLRRSRRRAHLEIILSDADSEILDILANLEREDIPQHALDEEETADLVGATLSSFPPRYRDVLTDKYLRDLPVREIARRHGATEKGIESLLTRARQAFARTFRLLARRRQGP
ncbi:MAG: sigma-70 family RNA polymerase sigma factor [Planctomycetes bacterium]|nr:sigma-70 family RNA polymerase sigma factor [Planctomycetota bacterium]